MFVVGTCSAGKDQKGRVGFGEVRDSWVERSQGHEGYGFQRKVE